MRKTALSATLLGVVGIANSWVSDASAQSSHPQADGPLAHYAWSARPVVVFAPSFADPRLQEQSAQLMERGADLRERQMPVLLAVGDQVRLNGAPIDLDAAALRRRYGVARGAFTLLLIGKDTGVKRRSMSPTPPQELFDQVDAMPMRQQEMRRSE